jgi:hypothetical protein
LKKELIILGTGPTRQECDYHCETWGCTFTYKFAKRLDKLFFTDEECEIEKCHYFEFDKMKALHPTLVLPIAYPLFKNLGLKIDIYPIKEVMEKFLWTTYYCDTLAYMIAYALYQGYNRLWMFGLDFYTDHTESFLEKPGIDYWMGVIHGMNVNGNHIEVITSVKTDLARTWNNRMYGEFGSMMDIGEIL